MEGKIFKTEVAGKELVVELGKYAEFANGSCLVKSGETVVMVNVTMSDKPREGIDFFKKNSTSWTKEAIIKIKNKVCKNSSPRGIIINL